ncbi:shikimate kinase [Paracrocinitomix mangrovi]|uniref:shikimate kinase n=1 Tax=Paracrocinitomix mangrovi TaxID=2862509 RepID=UPI001C8D2825|nr:shikimate kinase [Paracrocinitomix mangrovi]UKN01798.1 shikimate kinase [Paracrocinitomix mangrovi]
MQFFLIGFMGSGKTNAGKTLAEGLNLPFVDSDEAIEANEKMSISEIFAKKGEAYFRKVESDWLKNLDDSPGVYALGGGTPCSEQNINLILEKGLPIYLWVNEKDLASRLTQQKNQRPLIQNFKNELELANYISNTLRSRSPYYLKSKVIINNSNDKNVVQERLVDFLSSVS